MTNKTIWYDFLVPIAFLILISVLLTIGGNELRIAESFYSNGWIYRDVNPWAFLYRYGECQPYIIAVLGGIVFLAGFIFSKARPYRKTAVFFVLIMALGPGLIVNGILKDHWGRPRPNTIVNFGGHEKYHPVWQRGEPAEGKSFPSGHAAAGFSLLAPFFVLRKRHRKWARFFLISGILDGSIMGLGRMVQGGHYATDIIWSGGVVYLVGLSLYYLLRLDKDNLLDGCLCPSKADNADA